jgi:hypothetical protein
VSVFIRSSNLFTAALIVVESRPKRRANSTNVASDSSLTAQAAMLRASEGNRFCPGDAKSGPFSIVARVRLSTRHFNVSGTEIVAFQDNAVQWQPNICVAKHFAMV